MQGLSCDTGSECGECTAASLCRDLEFLIGQNYFIYDPKTEKLSTQMQFHHIASKMNHNCEMCSLCLWFGCGDLKCLCWCAVLHIHVNQRRCGFSALYWWRCILVLHLCP